MSGTKISMVVGGSQSLTATSGGGAPDVTADKGINTLATVAVAGDSVILPANMPQNARVIIFNDAAAKADVYPNSGATINGAAADAEVGIATKTTSEFIQAGTDGLTWLALGVTTAQS